MGLSGVSTSCAATSSITTLNRMMVLAIVRLRRIHSPQAEKPSRRPTPRRDRPGGAEGKSIFGEGWRHFYVD